MQVRDACSPGTSSEITLIDDGTGHDQVAHDAYYAAAWDPRSTPPWDTTPWKRLEVRAFEGSVDAGKIVDQFFTCGGGTDCACP